MEQYIVYIYEHANPQTAIFQTKIDLKISRTWVRFESMAIVHVRVFTCT